MKYRIYNKLTKQYENDDLTVLPSGLIAAYDESGGWTSNNQDDYTVELEGQENQAEQSEFIADLSSYLKNAFMTTHSMPGGPYTVTIACKRLKDIHKLHNLLCKIPE